MEKVLLDMAMVLVPIILSKLMKGSLLTKPIKHNKLPPGPWTLPLIGSMHHLVGNPLLHRAMRDLARKHGPLMMLWVGEVPTVVVSSPEAAHAITKTHDVTFAERHRNTTINIFTLNGINLVYGSYGERWRQLRKLSVQELLSAARVRSFQRIREEEVARFVRSLAVSAGTGAAVNMAKMIHAFVTDTFFREIMGGSGCKYHDEFLDAVEAVKRISWELSLENIFPSLSKVLQNLGMARPSRAMACRDRAASIVAPIIHEVREAMDQGDKTDSYEGMIPVLLRLRKEAGLPVELTDKVIILLLQDLFGAGTDTSSNALIWCMTELVRNPAVMARAQAEVREAFQGKATTTITEDDLARANLSYLNCVVNEALRDAKHWEDPEEFKPERFEGSNLDYNRRDYVFLPFGSGRRICPGVNFGVPNMELALASLLYHFDWKLPSGVEPKVVDISEAPGPVTKKSTGLLVHPVTHSFAPVNV